ncbi:hypothetical protein ACS0TY_020330 [Phlomoides rotata]
MALKSSIASHNRRFSAARNPRPNGQMLPHPNLRSFSYSELKAAARNFRSFGSVYKG